MTDEMIPDRCPKCGYPTTLLNITWISPRRQAVGCHVCGRVLALEWRHQDPPGSPLAAENAPPVTTGAGGVLAAKLDAAAAAVGDTWRGDLAATRPRRPGPIIVAEMAERLGMPPAFRVAARRNQQNRWVPVRDG